MALPVAVMSPENPKRFQCDYCDYASTQRGILKTHIQNIHIGVKHVCVHCNFKASSKGSLTNHINSKHLHITFKCDYCDYVSTQKGNLKTHIRTHHEKVTYNCEICGFKAASPGSLSNHITTNHERNEMKCKMCDFATLERSQLRKHVCRIHEPFVQIEEDDDELETDSINMEEQEFDVKLEQNHELGGQNKPARSRRKKCSVTKVGHFNGKKMRVKFASWFSAPK